MVESNGSGVRPQKRFSGCWGRQYKHFAYQHFHLMDLPWYPMENVAENTMTKNE